jgi:hypothetical protein
VLCFTKTRLSLSLSICVEEGTCSMDGGPARKGSRKAFASPFTTGKPLDKCKQVLYAPTRFTAYLS